MHTIEEMNEDLTSWQSIDHFLNSFNSSVNSSICNSMSKSNSVFTAELGFPASPASHDSSLSPHHLLTDSEEGEDFFSSPESSGLRPLGIPTFSNFSYFNDEMYNNNQAKCKNDVNQQRPRIAGKHRTDISGQFSDALMNMSTKELNKLFKSNPDGLNFAELKEARRKADHRLNTDRYRSKKLTGALLSNDNNNNKPSPAIKRSSTPKKHTTMTNTSIPLINEQKAQRSTPCCTEILSNKDNSNENLETIGSLR